MGPTRDSKDPFGIADGYTEAIPYESNEYDETLLSNLKEMFDKSHEYRAIYERQWELYRLFLKGDQTLRWDRARQEVVRLVSGDSRRLYSQNNQMRIVARSLVGKLTAMIPTFKVQPSTADPDEIYAARAGDAWLKFFRKKEHLDIVCQKMLSDLTWSGNAACELYWDPEAGPRVAYCPEVEEIDFDENLIGHPCEAARQQMQLTLENKYSAVAEQAMEVGAEVPEPPDGISDEEVPKYVELQLGDLRVRRVDIRDVFVEPGQEDPENFRYVFIREAVPVSTARARFPDFASFIHSDVNKFVGIHSRLSYSGNDEAALGDYLEDYVFQYRYYEKPSGLYPKGRIITYINEYIVEEIENSFSCLGRLPVFFFRWTTNPGEFYAESPSSQAWHRQKELNVLETIVREHNELLSRPPLLNPFGSKISVDEISAVTGQSIKYNPQAGRVEYLIPPPLPNWIPQRIMELKVDIRDQFAVTENDMGQMPSDPNGRAMAILQAESSNALGPINRANWAEWKELHRGILIMTRKLYDDRRKFSIPGDYQSAETFLLLDAMNLEDGWDLDLEIEDGLSKNQALRQQQVLEMVNSGLLIDKATGTPDEDRIARLANIKLLSKDVDEERQDYSRAMAMIQKIIDGDIPEPKDEDSPKIFAKVALQWLKGKAPRFEERGLHQTVELVREMHRFYSQMQMQLEMAAQGLEMPGGAPQPPGAGGPNSPSPPGGTPGMSGGSGEGGGNPIRAGAQQMVQGADRGAEMQAKVQTKHEG